MTTYKFEFNAAHMLFLPSSVCCMLILFSHYLFILLIYNISKRFVRQIKALYFIILILLDLDSLVSTQETLIIRSRHAILSAFPFLSM